MSKKTPRCICEIDRSTELLAATWTIINRNDIILDYMNQFENTNTGEHLICAVNEHLNGVADKLRKKKRAKKVIPFPKEGRL